MSRPPRDPQVTITRRGAVLTWLLYAAVLFLAAVSPLVIGPDTPSTDRPTASLTMTFVVMGLGTAFNAVVNRRDPASGFGPPLLKALLIAMIPVTMMFLATQLPSLQQALLTTTLTSGQWLTCFLLAAALPVVVEISKAVRRRRLVVPEPVDVQRAVTPVRAQGTR
jgi:Ca2+-transporting ATPase